MTELLPVFFLTVRVSGSALILAALVGIPLGVFLGLGNFPGKRPANLVFSAGMGLPPVVVGLVVYIVLSRSGPLGSLELLFTPSAMILAQAVLALPIAASLTSTAVAAIPEELVIQIRSLGTDPWQERWTVIYEARKGVLAAVLAAFGRIISEVGAVVLVGGNIDGRTRVLSTAILLETRQGNFEFALLLGVVLLGLALLGNGLLIWAGSARDLRAKK